MKKLLTVCLAAVALYFSITYSNDKAGSSSAHIPGGFLPAQKIGEVVLSISDYGVIELYNLGDFDSSFTNSIQSGQIPEHFPNNPLFSGALWIGALAEDTLVHGKFDTLVTTGGGWFDIREFQPPNLPAESNPQSQHIADNEVFAVYYDTVTNFDIISPDIYSRPYQPLGLKITQHSMTWNSAGYDEYVIVDFYIKNVYKRDLREVWLGFCMAGVQRQSKDNSRLESNGIFSGFMDYQNHGVGWLRANAGAADGAPLDSHKSSIVIGLMPVGSSCGELGTNFNWWLSDLNSGYDWGPQWQSNFDVWGAFPGGGKGMPVGVIAKYQVMANGEIDYDQANSAYDWTKEGWIENDISNRDDFKGDINANMLISLGPFNLKAGEVETVTVAMMTCNLDNQTPDYPRLNLSGLPVDSNSIDNNVNISDYSEILISADTILNYYNQGFDKIPPGSPRNFIFESWDGNQINLAWNRRDHALFGDYRIYRGTKTGVYNSIPITPPNFTDTFFIDNTVLDNTVYYYIIKSANIYAAEGGASPEIAINSGQPQTPEGLTAWASNGRVQLEWQPNRDDDLRGYIIYRNISETIDSEIIDTTKATAYFNTGLNNGLRYWYKIKALDMFGNLSYYSDSVTAIPMAFDSGIMLVNANSDESINPDYDSMAVFYESVLQDHRHVVVDKCPLDLPQLSPYSTIIWCKEILPGRSRFDHQVYLDLFSDYLGAGGKLIIAGTRIINNELFEGLLMFNETDFYYEYLNLEGIDYPSIADVEFTGGRANLPGLPDFGIDPFRAGRIIFPFENRTNRLFGIGTLMPQDSSEVIYNYLAANPDTSRFNERPIGIIHETDIFKTAVLEFPLYYVEAFAARDILYKILKIFGETAAIEAQLAIIPDEVELMQNYPNPFNFRTEIRYYLPKNCQVSIEIFDILGRNIIKVLDEIQTAGQHSLIWDGRSSNGQLATSGIYFYRLATPDEATTKRMVFLK